MSASLEKTETSLLIIQTRFNYMINQHQISKFKMQPQAVYGSDISLSKATCANLGLNILKVPTYVPSDIYPCKSRRQTQTWFIISLSCDLEPEITIPKFRKIFILADLDPDLSSGLNPGRLIALVFRKTSYIDTHTSRLWLQTRFLISLSCDLEPELPWLYPGIFFYRLIWILICQQVSIMTGEFLESYTNHFLLTFLAMILKKLKRDENWAVNCGYVWWEISYIYFPDTYLAYI